MTPTLTSHCVTKLDFQPTPPADARLPIFSWNGVQLNRFSEKTVAIDVGTDPGQLAQIIGALYPKLTICELARLDQCLTEIKCNSEHTLELFSNLLGVHDIKLLKQLLATVLILPVEIQQQLSSKKLSFHQLAAITEIQPKACLQILQLLCSHQLSNQLFSQALELAVELILFDRQLDWDCLSSMTAEQLMVTLKKARYPDITERDSQKLTALIDMSFSKKTKVTQNRQGDRSGFDLRSTFFSKADVSRLIRDLEKIKQVLP